MTTIEELPKPNALSDAKRWMAGEISLGRFIWNSSLESCYAQAADFAGGIANAYDEKLQQLQQQLEATQKACAEMRDALESVKSVLETDEADSLICECADREYGCERCSYFIKKQRIVNHALSSNCGKDYVHVSCVLDQAQFHQELEAAQKRIAELEKDKQRLLNVARGCLDYGGGYRHEGHLLEIFHHGIQTVINALEAAVKNDPSDTQVNALEKIGVTTKT